MRNYGLRDRRAVKLTPLQFASGELPDYDQWEYPEEPRRSLRPLALAIACCWLAIAAAGFAWHRGWLL